MVRYTYYLEGTMVGGSNNEDVTFNVDLHTLIPVSLINRKFILRSSFATKRMTAVNWIYNALRISMRWPDGGYNRNKSNKPNGAMLLGYTKPYNNAYDDDQWSHQYTENECDEKVVPYPTMYPLVIQIFTISGGLFPSGALIGLNLSWELIPEL